MKFDALTHKLKNNHNKTIKSTEETFIHFIMHSHLRCMSSHGTHGSDKCRKEKQTTKKKKNVNLFSPSTSFYAILLCIYLKQRVV